MNVITFTVNGERYSLRGKEVRADTSLNDYLRYHLQLHGTKAMCHEGGCGACVVSVSAVNPNTKKKEVFAVNSCLVSILSCHEWDIKTVEDIRNDEDGYHPLQVNLAAFNGTQCGYCTPGYVMSMYSLVQSYSALTTKQVENCIGGNMCRCTGYRSILEAFKLGVTDVEYDNSIQDLEDMPLIRCSKDYERPRSLSENEECLTGDKPDTFMEINIKGGKWFKAYTLQDVFKILSFPATTFSYRLVAGNTGKGVYPISSEARTIIDISSIESLKLVKADVCLNIGAGKPLTDVMKIFRNWCFKDNRFNYLIQYYYHLNLVAHTPVRNVATIGGNLAMKHQHPDFPSDIFLLLLTVNASIIIVNNDLSKTEIKMDDFMKADIEDKIITEVKLPPLSIDTFVRTYKIMPRAQNARAIVNAGFLFRRDTVTKIITAIIIVFGNINPEFTRAFETENLLMGRDLNNIVLQSALKKLSDELVPLDTPPEPSPACRKMIALGLFYKTMLTFSENSRLRYWSGGNRLSRDLSRSTQTYDTKQDLWPLNKAVPKIEGLAQCAGAASYSCDVFSGPREVHVAFVLSTICRGELLGFNTGDVMRIPGVIAFFSAKDIPGKNSFTSPEFSWLGSDEEIFASSTISFNGQPLGVIVANSRKLAQTAAKLVNVKYNKLDVKPVLTIRDALSAPDKDKRLRQDAKIDAVAKGTDIKHKFSGTFSVPSQYHYTMETQSCHVSVSDSTIVVRSSTQWLDLIKIAVAQALGVTVNMVLVEVPRIGGGYGSKVTRSSQIACACALVAYNLNRPASLVMSMTDNMAAIGKRQACEFDYECAVNDEGFIQYLNVTYYSDNGCSFNDSVAADIATYISSAYINDGFSIVGYSVLTDKPSETWCRAPGTTEAIAFIEHIMERISHITDRDHIYIRLKNLRPKHHPLIDMITSIKQYTNFDDRKIAVSQYNKINAWKKKGLKLGLACYPIGYSENYPVTISIYHADGTVAISHGGIEMGQGINTKVAQVCAHSLQIPLEKVVFRNSSSFVSPTTSASNDGTTSDLVAYATMRACSELLKRLEPVREELYKPTWEEVVKRAYKNDNCPQYLHILNQLLFFTPGVNLQASYMTSKNDHLVGYDVYGVCVAEVELDVLTGIHIVRRVDILEDTGISINPEIDIGQIEGAFVMGLGLWTFENLVYDKTSGRLLTDRTWTYSLPGIKDIPENFNVKFRPESSTRYGVLKFKATGEPALALAVVVTHALHEAIVEARKEFRYQDNDWVCVGTPYTIENILTAISPKIEYFLIN